MRALQDADARPMPGVHPPRVRRVLAARRPAPLPELRCSAVIVAIVGSRDFPKLTRIDDRVYRLRDDVPDLKIISGGARGADSRARWACRFWGVEFEEYEADWTHLGRPERMTR